jgi:hypothetical protein
MKALQIGRKEQCQPSPPASRSLSAINLLPAVERVDVLFDDDAAGEHQLSPYAP